MNRDETEVDAPRRNGTICRIAPIVPLVVLCIARLGAQAGAALSARIVAAARSQIGVTTDYDPRYVALAYPGGDVPQRTGVCCDVVVRALRPVGLDLQQAVHEDMLAAFSAYPTNWGLRKPDANIDHRRVANLACYLGRKQLAVTDGLARAATYRPGDIVVWDLGAGVLHIGIVSDRRSRDVPLIVHNIGAGVREEDLLFRYRIIGHYRVTDVPARTPAPPAAAAGTGGTR